MRGFILIPALIAASAPGWAQPTFLVEDINTGIGSSISSQDSSNPGLFTPAGSQLFFLASDGQNGPELWVSDGTQVGTRFVADIQPGLSGGNIEFPRVLGETLYFSAQVDDAYGMWRSDGTPEGTTLVEADMVFRESIEFNGQLLFAGDRSLVGSELFLTDGSPGGAQLVKNIRPGGQSSNIGSFAELGGVIYFRAEDGISGRELWRTDGTEAGTQPVLDINLGAAHSSPGFLTASGGWIYFQADDGAHGDELWRTNGDPAQTEMVKDIASGSEDSEPRQLIDADGKLFFIAESDATGIEVWTTDGTEIGTVPARDIVAGSGSSDPDFLVALGDQVLFQANGGGIDYNLWISDGTELGTEIVTPTLSGSRPEFLVRVGELIYFSADPTGNPHRELWVTDGTSIGTRQVKDIDPFEDGDPRDLAAWGDRLAFSAREENFGREPWISDGSEQGTNRLQDIRQPVTSSQIRELVATEYHAFFRANDEVHGTEVWTAQAAPGAAEVLLDHTPGSSSSRPRWLTSVGNRLFFAGAPDTSEVGNELYVSDGTPQGTAKVKDIYPDEPGGSMFGSTPELLTPFKNGVLFIANSPGVAWGLWKSDGTTTGTMLIADIYPPIAISQRDITEIETVGDQAFVSAWSPGAGLELWVTDGEPGAASLVMDIAPEALSSSPEQLTAVGDLVYFLADDGVNGRQIWTSGGAEDGAERVTDLTIPFSNIDELTGVGERLFFVAVSNFGRTVWVLDGPGFDPRALKEFSSNGPENPELLTAMGDVLLFRARDDNHGFELWKSDGTVEGTQLVSDIRPGPAGSGLDSIFAVSQGLAVFAASDGIHGRELWVTDGSPNGTRIIEDIEPGPSSSSPERFALGAIHLFFVADERNTGIELWAVQRRHLTALAGLGSRWSDYK